MAIAARLFTVTDRPSTQVEATEVDPAEHGVVVTSSAWPAHAGEGRRPLLVGAVAVVLVVRAISGGVGGAGRTGSRAMYILDERFARGEIDREEYEERRRALTGD